MNFIEVNDYRQRNPRMLINIEDIGIVSEEDFIKDGHVIKCSIVCRGNEPIYLSDEYDDVLRTLRMTNEKKGQEGTVNITKINDLYVDDIESNEALDEEQLNSFRVIIS